MDDVEQVDGVELLGGAELRQTLDGGAVVGKGRDDRKRRPAAALPLLAKKLREIYRLHEAQFARGYDIVVVARTRAIGADYAALERAYLSLAAKLGLLGGQTA